MDLCDGLPLFDENTGERPDLTQVEDGVTFTSQAVTPMRAKIARYAIPSWPLPTWPSTKTRPLSKSGGQSSMSHPDPQIMPTSADLGVTMFNRLIARFIRDESGPLRQVS
jgi:hypothetical protein